MDDSTLPPALPESRLYTFIDEPRRFAVYFLEGQKLIHDLALLHDLQGPGFAYFRDVVLSVQPMIALLKHGEQLGFYIDSEDPWFRLKIETGHAGATRCALIPEEFREFPAALTGLVRLLKLFPGNRPPYESVLEARQSPLRAIVNHALRESYQMNAACMVSSRSDQSLMLHQLPPLRSEDYEYSIEAVRARRAQLESGVQELFDRALHRSEDLERAFRPLGFRLLAVRDVRFQCVCSRQRVIDNIQLACGDDLGQLFDPGQDELQVTCEYCKSRYRVTRDDLSGGPSAVH